MDLQAIEVFSLGSELYRIRLRVMEGFSHWNMSDNRFLLNEQENGSVTAPDDPGGSGVASAAWCRWCRGCPLPSQAVLFLLFGVFFANENAVSLDTVLPAFHG